MNKTQKLNGIIKAIEFKKIIEHASSMCYVVKASDSKLWVVRAKKKNKNSKRLLNEYIARRLASYFDLIPPEGKIIYISKNVHAVINSELFDTSVNYSTATEFIADLKHVQPPNNISCLNPEFPTINREHLLNVFGKRYNFEKFHAYYVFSKWIVLEDDWEYSNLFYVKVNKSLEPIFIDFDMSLGGGEWDSLPTSVSLFCE